MASLARITKMARIIKMARITKMTRIIKMTYSTANVPFNAKYFLFLTLN